MGETVTEVPLPSEVPPHEPLYQYQSLEIFNLPLSMLKVVELPLQMLVAEASSEGASATGLTVIVMLPQDPLQEPSPRA